MNFKKISITFSLILFALLTFSSCDNKNKEEKNQEKVQVIVVDTISIKKQAYPLWIDFTGKTQAYEKVELLARASGELKEILFKAGNEVKKGDILFKIDDREIKSVLAQKQASLAKNKASLNLAISSVKRYTPLVNKGLAPKEKLEELQAVQKQNEAIGKADKEAIKQAQIDLDFTSVKASINGQIGKALVDVGNIISASKTTLANIINAKILYVNFNPSANEVSLIKKYSSSKNQKVIIEAGDKNQSLSLAGHIDFIDNTSNESTGTVAMRAKIENKENLLFPGTFVNIKLFISDKIEFFALHPNNISQNQLGSYVLLVNDKNKIQTRQIKVSYSNKTLAIIKSGLKQGDRVILSSITKLKEDQEVKVNEVKNPLND